jgi:hypothetical protein
MSEMIEIVFKAKRNEENECEINKIVFFNIELSLKQNQELQSFIFFAKTIAKNLDKNLSGAVFHYPTKNPIFQGQIIVEDIFVKTDYYQWCEN